MQQGHLGPQPAALAAEDVEVLLVSHEHNVAPAARDAGPLVEGAPVGQGERTRDAEGQDDHGAARLELESNGDDREREEQGGERGEKGGDEMHARIVEAQHVRPGSVPVDQIQRGDEDEGGRPNGSLSIRGETGATLTLVEAIANLVAIGLERARAIERAATAEAARRNEELRAA